MKESLVALILKRIAAPTRYLLSLFAAVLGLCVNCNADSLVVIQNFNVGNADAPIIIRSDSSGITVAMVFPADVGTNDRELSVPALPAGAEVTSATFSIINFTGTETAPGGYQGRTQTQLEYEGALAIGPDGLGDGPCLPPSCAPTIANVSVGWRVGLADNCVDFNDARNLGTNCFKAPVTGSFNLLSLGKPSSYLADGFLVGTTGLFEDVYLCCDNPTLDQILYPGLNSITEYGSSGPALEIQEEVLVDYTLPTTVPEPATPLLLIPGLLALAALRLKKGAA
jgi:hypothetical protein